MEYKLPPLRKPDDYTVSMTISGMVTITGKRSIGRFFFRSKCGKFHSKDHYESSLRDAPSYEFPEAFLEQCASAWKWTEDSKKWLFQHISDPGHGWLSVPIWFLKDLKIEGSISRYSYISRDGLTGYLEEDADASRFWEAFRAKYEHEPRCHHSNSNSSSPLRDLPSFHVDLFSPHLF